MISAHATTKKIQKNIVKIPLKELKGCDGGGGHLMQKNTVKEKLNKKTNQNGRQVVLLHQY